MKEYSVEFRDSKTGLIEFVTSVKTMYYNNIVSLARVQAFGDGFRFNRNKHFITIVEIVVAI